METEQSRRSVVEEWCAAMERQGYEGRCRLSNLLHDIQENRIEDERVLQHFFEDVATLWKDGAKGCMDVFREAVVKGNGAYTLKGRTVSAGSGRYSTVVMSKHLREHNLELETTGGPSIKGLPLEEAQIEVIIKGLDFFRKNPHHPAAKDPTKGKIRGELPLAWITTTDDLDEVKREALGEQRRKTPDRRCADAVRTHLGLLHFKYDRAIEIKYPEGTLNDNELRAPTFLEGCSSRVFQCRTDPDGWGRAADLETVGKPGGPEAVHEPVEFTSAFELEYLGHLPYPRVWNEKKQKAFLKTFLHKWTRAAFKYLEKYV